MIVSPATNTSGSAPVARTGVAISKLVAAITHASGCAVGSIQFQSALARHSDERSLPLVTIVAGSSIDAGGAGVMHTVQSPAPVQPAGTASDGNGSSSPASCLQPAASSSTA